MIVRKYTISDNNSNYINVDVNIETSVPIVSIKDKLVDAVEYDSFSITKNPSMDNKIYDIDGNECKVLLETSSYYRKFNYCIIRDNINNDYVLIPSIDNYDPEILHQSYLKLTGFKIGADNTNNDGIVKESLLIKYSDTDVPEVSSNYLIGRILNVHGLYNNVKASTITSGPDTLLPINLIVFIEMEMDDPVHIHTLRPDDLVKNRITYTGYKKTDKKLYIPIPF